MVQTFNINQNSFTGTVPTQLGEWTDMTAGLQLRQNRFTGKIPSQFGRWSNFIGTYEQANGDTQTTAGYGFRIGLNSFSGEIPRYEKWK